LYIATPYVPEPGKKAEFHVEFQVVEKPKKEHFPKTCLALKPLKHHPIHLHLGYSGSNAVFV
jgi:hypothetical protein